MEGMAIGHNFERDRSKDHPGQVWFNLNDELFNINYGIFYEL
jgi:hypothetical protein